MPLGGSEKKFLVPPGPAMVTDPSQLQAAPGCPRCEAGGCVGTRWSPKCPTLESVAYMASEEGVDHQEAHFRPALLLRGIPADLDPASEGRAVLTAKACAGFLLNASLKFRVWSRKGCPEAGTSLVPPDPHYFGGPGQFCRYAFTQKPAPAFAVSTALPSEAGSRSAGMPRSNSAGRKWGTQCAS